MKFCKFLLLAATLFTTACGQGEVRYVYLQPGQMPPGAEGAYPQQMAGGMNQAYPQQQYPAQNGLYQQQAAPTAQGIAPQAMQQMPQQAAAPAAGKTAPQAAAPAAGKTAPQAAAPAAGKTSTAKMTVEQKLLTKANQSFAALQTLSADVVTFEKGLDGKDGNGKVKFLYKKPGSVKVEVKNSPDPSQVGVKLAYSTSGQVKVRPSGALSLVSVSLDMTDGKLLSGRKYKLNEIDLVSVMSRLTKPGLQAKLKGQTAMGGSKVVLIEIIPQGHFDPKITKEILGLDMKTFMPRIHEMYQGETKVYGVQIPSITVNAPLSAADFEV